MSTRYVSPKPGSLLEADIWNLEVALEADAELGGSYREMITSLITEVRRLKHVAGITDLSLLADAVAWGQPWTQPDIDNSTADRSFRRVLKALSETMFDDVDADKVSRKTRLPLAQVRSYFDALTKANILGRSQRV